MPQTSNREHYERMRREHYDHIRRDHARYASLSRSPSPRRATTTSTYTPRRYASANRDAESSRAHAEEPRTSQDVMPFHDWMYNLGHWHGFNEGTARVVEQTYVAKQPKKYSQRKSHANNLVIVDLALTAGDQGFDTFWLGWIL